LQFGKFKFQITLETDAILPPFKGSTFRGVFGTALKKTVCALKSQTCETCLLRDRCVYTLVFEIPPDREPEGAPSPPHPFIIEPPLTTKTHFTAGDSLDFNLLLFGRANDYLPYFVYAVEQMGRTGIGQRVNGHRAVFQLTSVSAGEQVVYEAEDRKLLAVSPSDLSWERFAAEHPPFQCREIYVRLETPLRLKFENRLQAELPFHVLVRALLRRVALLNRHFGNGEPDLDYKGLVAKAQQKIPTKESRLRWFDWKRYSNRQEQAMLMGGMTGEISYQGDLEEFIPLIKFGELVHVGKATAFGLGKFSARFSPSPHRGEEGRGEGVDSP
jgi:hypothetical protein